METGDRRYAYHGHRSKNSMIGNLLRSSGNAAILMALKGSPKSRIKGHEAEALARKHGADFELDKTNKNNAVYQYAKGNVKISPNLLYKHIVAHEVGHHNSMKDPKSFNSKLINGNKDSATVIRAEREAWVQTAKLVGKPKTRTDKIVRGAALGTYERKLELQDQMAKFKNDPEYTKKMLKRTAVKVGGGVAGGVVGNRIAHILVSKLRKERDLLLHKPNKTEAEYDKLRSLRTKISRYKKLGTVTGAIGGYALSKKYLTKSID